MKFHYAKKQFEENLRLFGDANINPEKYNLYAGLMNLADGLQKIETQLDHIEQKTKHL